MGRLIDGRWSTEWYHPDAKGRFVREDTKFHDWITSDGRSGYPAVGGRYHLYVSLACPWAHRTLILRKLKGLESVIDVTVVDPHMGDDGWAFSDYPQCRPDPNVGAAFLRELYTRAHPTYTGRVTVPVLWDTQAGTIVNNESREIMRMLDTELDALAERPVSFCPPDLRAEIDAIIDDIYEPINNGVYRSGFAVSQQAYEEAVKQLFATLERYDAWLGSRRYLCGDRITEADWCLFTTLVRFDAVYHGHFKCNLRRISDFPNLSGYLRELYQVPGVRETVDFDHIKVHYYWSHTTVNPTRIVPVGPELDLDAPHGRASIGAAAAD